MFPEAFLEIPAMLLDSRKGICTCWKYTSIYQQLLVHFSAENVYSSVSENSSNTLGFADANGAAKLLLDYPTVLFSVRSRCFWHAFGKNQRYGWFGGYKWMPTCKKIATYQNYSKFEKKIRLYLFLIGLGGHEARKCESRQNFFFLFLERTPNSDTNLGTFCVVNFKNRNVG